MQADSAMLWASTRLPACTLAELEVTQLSDGDGGRRGVTEKISKPAGDRFKGQKVTAFPSHDHAQTFRLQKRAQLPRHVQRKILFGAVTTERALVVAAVPRVQNYRSNFTCVGNAVRTHQRLDRLGHICARNQEFSIMLEQGEA